MYIAQLECITTVSVIKDSKQMSKVIWQKAASLTSHPLRLQMDLSHLDFPPNT